MQILWIPTAIPLLNALMGVQAESCVSGRRPAGQADLAISLSVALG